MIWRKHIHEVVLRLPDSRSNWNLDMLVFEERGKPEYGEKPLGAKEGTNNKLFFFLSGGKDTIRAAQSRNPASSGQIALGD